MNGSDEVIIDKFGSLFRTKVTKDGGLLCPICGEKEGAPIFFSEEDLIRHLTRHELRKKESGGESNAPE
ncbi:MAG: hypothetical protein C0179_02555 [Fervidicoccus sp.]|nr:MAG: hypothetical protein C0179_02555 [Fervidicoccus sp.]